MKKIVEEIVASCIEGKLLQRIHKHTFGKVIKLIDRAISYPSIWLYSKTVSVNDNKIVFVTTRGEYDCNAKWITEELICREVPYEIVWIIRREASKKLFPKRVALAYRQSAKSFMHLASARIIVDNSTSIAYMGYRKKKGQILIETWHGSIGIKRFGKDTNKDKRWIRMATLEGRMTDYCLSNSEMEDNIFKDTFWVNSRILRCGHARNDILFEKDSERRREIRESIYKKYNLDSNVKICLYAPTFRDDGDLSPYQIDYAGLADALKNRFGGEWVIMTRFHFLIMKKYSKINVAPNVIDVSKYADIQELLACIDVGITDYSSWICEYMLTGKPGFLFATDMTSYEKNDREFFYPLDTLPFPLAVNNEELIHNICEFDEEKFKENCVNFLKDKGCIDDGLASYRICNFIESIMRGEQVW